MALSSFPPMNWTKLLYVAIIALLYVPMVFLGANVFLPKYSGDDTYFRGYEECWRKGPVAAPETLTKEETVARDEQISACEQENRQKEAVWNSEKRHYESWKYVFIAGFNLAVLLLALFLSKLQESVLMGLFVGSVIATFSSTITYFNTNSRIGFGILVVTFFAVLYFINKKKETFLDWRGKGEAKGK